MSGWMDGMKWSTANIKVDIHDGFPVRHFHESLKARTGQFLIGIPIYASDDD